MIPHVPPEGVRVEPASGSSGTERADDVESASAALKTIKVAHTVVWAFFAGCVVAIPVVVWRGKQRAAAWLIAIVAGEVAVLVLNKWRCPLSSVAARYTNDRRRNFDIYLPKWLATYNKLIFGALYFGGGVFALVRWLRAPR